MKLKSRRFLTAIVSFCLLLNVITATSTATTKASDYYAATLVLSSALGGGDVLFEFDVSATEVMDELGVRTVVVWEQHSDGSHTKVHTYTRYNTSGFIDEDVAWYYGKVTYHGTPGVKYYATVEFYAKNSEGNESLYSNTKVVTA